MSDHELFYCFLRPAERRCVNCQLTQQQSYDPLSLALQLFWPDVGLSIPNQDGIEEKRALAKSGIERKRGIVCRFGRRADTAPQRQEEVSVNQTTKESIADVLAEARMKLDDALKRSQAGEAPGTLSKTALAKLQAAADNTSCTNTACGGAERERD